MRVPEGKIHVFWRGSAGKIRIQWAEYYVIGVASTRERGNSVKVTQNRGKTTDLATLKVSHDPDVARVVIIRV